MPRSDYLLLKLFVIILLIASLPLPPVAPKPIAFASLLPHRCLVVVAVTSQSPRPPFRPPSSSSRLPSPPHENSDGDGDHHRHRRSLSLPVLLPPPMPFFPPPSPMPPSPLSGCVRRAGCSGGTATPAVICDGSDGRTTKARYGTASVAASAAAEATEATEEEENNGWEGAEPRRHLDNALLRQADKILLRSIIRRWSPATATTSMPASDIGALFIQREDREGNDGSGIVTEDDNNTDAEAGGYARNFLEVVLRRL